ncbi:linker for activation of T-cells family member 1 isoform X1 [Saimiri boliviensis]|uniref:linker for activation of T-cells family member 1 isoform X1 n=1 Tax=Saimiri boliviensis TaxID=27679 RepID=UPI000533CB77|nr:linker for activation of T-cells family member 1 isoform X4 [Saimiri boliviensis boliviensis]
MEGTVLVPCVLGLLLLPILAVLMALCVHCHRLPGSYDSTSSDSLYPRGIQIKRPYTLAPRPPTYPPVTSYPPLSQPDLLPIPRSPQPPGGSHRTPSSRRDSDGANSVPSYENEGASGIRGARAGWGGWGPCSARLTPVLLPPEPACEDEDEDEDEDDYHNPGYLEVLPDSAPAASTAAPPAPVLSTPGLRDSAFSMESIDDYVNVPESGESAEASLDGSREYVNVSQELHPGGAKTEAATLSSQEAEEVEEEGAPDYENLQELN